MKKILITLIIVFLKINISWAQHCNPNWTAAYSCMEGCGGCPANSVPATSSVSYNYQAAQALQAAQEAAKKQRINDEVQDLNQQGLDAYNRGDYETAIEFYQDALDKRPNDPSILQNIQTAKDQIAAIEQRKQEAFNQSKQEGLNQLKDISQGGSLDSDSGLKGIGSTDSGLKDISNVNTDTHVVDARNVPSGLPKSVDDAITTGYAGAPNGVSDRVRKGFQAITTHDWKVAKAWFEDALNHDPNNLGLKRLVELADYTERRKEQIAANKGTKSITSASLIQLPEDSDIKLLFPDEQPAQAGLASIPADKMPKDSDIELLFPGLPAIEAKEIDDYMFDQMEKATENDPELIRISNRLPILNQSKNSSTLRN